MISLTTKDYIILGRINQVSASLSIAGSLFILSCFFFLKKHLKSNQIMFELVAWMSLAYLIAGIGNVLGYLGDNNGGLCQFQAIFRSFGQLAGLLFTLAIAFILHQVVISKNYAYRLENSESHFRKKIIWVSWLIAIIFTIIPICFHSYGPTGGWCWIVGDGTWNQILRFFCWYIILFFAMAYCWWVYWNLAKIMRETHGDSPIASKNNKYVIALVLCYLFSSINRIYQLISSDESLVLSALHISFSSCAGLVNALVYGLTDEVVVALRTFFAERGCG
jgi:hypothetical protein